jgi:hypothetical protein
MRPLLPRLPQTQLMLSALFVAALSFITLAASFAEMPEETTAKAASVNE